MENTFMKSLKIGALIVLSILMTSCNDYLDLAPENELIKDNFWTKSEDVNGALSATYRALQSSTMENLVWGELRGDLINVGYGSGYTDIKQSIIMPTNWEIRWSNYYKTINLANTLMQFSGKVVENDKSFTPKMKDAIDAEALFVRSLCYFYLVRLWKDVPLVIEASVSDEVNLFPAKTKEHVIMAQIISDLLVAKDKAYTTEFSNKDIYYKGRANKYSIMALLADVYLWNQEHEKCNAICQELIDLQLFDLEPATDWMNVYYPGNSIRESLFEIQYDEKLGYESPVNANLGAFKLTSAVTFEPNDIRKIGANKYKFKNLNKLQRTRDENDSHFIYYRYADILLMKAEALNELGLILEANEYYKKTYLRATGEEPDNILDKEELTKAILDERGREFVCEGKRWFDLLRNAKRNHFRNIKSLEEHLAGMMKPEHVNILKPNLSDSNFLFLPMPQSEIKVNPNLIQTPFYDR